MHVEDIMRISRGFSVHQRDAMIISKEYDACICMLGISWVYRGCSVQQRGTMMITGGCHDSCGVYHEDFGGCSLEECHHYVADVQYILLFSARLDAFFRVRHIFIQFLLSKFFGGFLNSYQCFYYCYLNFDRWEMFAEDVYLDLILL